MKKIILCIFLSLGMGLWVYAQNKPNDYLVAKINCPTCGAAKFKWGELTPQNTQFLSKSEYRRMPFVEREFTVNGTFNEAEWSRFYDLLAEEWGRFCYWDYKRCATMEIEYDPYARYKPIDVKVIKCHGCTFWKSIK